MLPAQARKRLALTGTRNTYVVQAETEFDVTTTKGRDLTQSLNDDSPLKLVRTGMPVFVGSGESDEEILTYTQQNIEQIRQATGDKRVHMLSLNTDMRFEHQDQMLKQLRAVCNVENSQCELSNVPVNLIGTFYPSSISPTLLDKIPEQDKKPTVAQKAQRLAIARDVLMAASDIDDTVSVVMCASGQDRTGSVVESSIQQHTLNKWLKHKPNIQHNTDEIKDAKNEIDASRALGTNAAEIASFLSPGSPGMKEVSIANDYITSGRSFSMESELALYRKSANKNTSNPVEISLNMTLKKSSQSQYKAFDEAIKALQKKCIVDINDSPALNDVKLSGLKLMAEMIKKDEAPAIDYDEESTDFIFAIQRRIRTMEHAIQTYFLTGKNALLGSSGINNSKDIMNMTYTLETAAKAISAMEAGDFDTLDREIKHLEIVKKKLPGHKSVGFQIAAFCIVLLVVVGLTVAVNSTPISAVVFATAGAIAAILASTAVNVLSSGLRNTLIASKHLFISGLEGKEANIAREFKSILKEKAKLHQDYIHHKDKKNNDDLDHENPNSEQGIQTKQRKKH